MSKQQMIEHLISTAPESNTEPNNSFLSELSLAKDWLTEEEDIAWKDL